MNKNNTWLITVFAVVLVFVCLISYLNAQANSSLLRPNIEDLEYKAFLLRPKPSIEDLEYKALDKLRGNAEFAANRDYAVYEKFGSIIFCNTSFNSRIESANYAKQMELYISGKEADLSELDTAIKDYENERSKCRDFNP
mgnify:CR=1 FL=1